jgi:hypothetical protein
MHEAPLAGPFGLEETSLVFLQLPGAHKLSISHDTPNSQFLAR